MAVPPFKFFNKYGMPAATAPNKTAKPIPNITPPPDATPPNKNNTPITPPPIRIDFNNF